MLGLGHMSTLTEEQRIELARSTARVQAEHEAAKVIARIVAAAGGEVFVADSMVIGDDPELLVSSDPIRGGTRYVVKGIAGH